MSEEISDESLKKSIQIVGELYPVLENQDGKILDGNHRVESNPKHHRKTVQTKNRIEEILVRVHAHHRRRIPQEETKALVDELAVELVKDEIPKNLVSARLAELLPYSPGYIRQLLPEEFKMPEKVEAGKVSAQLSTQKNAASALEQSSKTSDRVECERCHVVNGSAKDWEGHKLCQIHYANALENPTQMHRYFQLIREAKNKIVPEVKLIKPHDLDSWPQRKAEMSPQHSKMEENVILALSDKGVHNIVQDREFCVTSSTPDIYLPEHKLVVYLDGIVHEGREDKDEILRDKLKARYDVRVLSIKYEGNSKGEVDRLVKLIQGELKS